MSPPVIQSVDVKKRQSFSRRDLLTVFTKASRGDDNKPKVFVEKIDDLTIEDKVLLGTGGGKEPPTKKWL